MMKFCFAVLFAFSVFAPAGAGVVITGEAESGAQKMYITGDSLRFDAGEDGSIIFKKKGGENVLFVIDRGEGVYYEITSGNVKEIVNMLEQAKKMMEQSLRHMPEAQREEMNKMMQERFGAAAAERKVELEQRGVGVKDWTADRYAVYVDGKKASLAWFAPPGQFGISSDDLSVLEDVEKFWEPLSALDMDSGAMFFSGIDSAGIPVKIVEVDEAGRESAVFFADEVKRQAVSPSVFEIPPGLRRKDIPFGGR
jgi:hypothetical protein